MAAGLPDRIARDLAESIHHSPLAQCSKQSIEESVDGLHVVARRSSGAVDPSVGGGLVCAWAVAAAMRRLWTAICSNHRYRVTTSRCANVLAWLLLVGVLLKLAL